MSKKTGEVIKIFNKRNMTILFIFNIMLALSNVSLSLILEKLINTSIKNESLSYKFLIYFIILAITACILKAFQKYMIEIISFLFKRDTSKRILKKYQNDRLIDFQKDNNAKRSYLLTERVEKFSKFLENNLIDLSYTPIYFIFTFVAMMIVDFKVSLIIIPVILIGVFLDIYFSKALIISSENLYKLEDVLVNFEKEMVLRKPLVMKTDIREYIKSLNGKNIKRWVDAQNHLIKRSQISYMPALINEYMPQIALCVITIIRYLIGKRMNYGEFMALLTLTHNVSLPIAHSLRAYTSLRSKRPIINEIENNISYDKNDFLSEKLDFEILVSIKNADIGYQKIILKDVNLDVKKGQIIALSGQSGSGKSTLLKNILGIYPPKNGDIKVFGVDAFKNQKEIFKYISYVDNENFMFDETLLFNVTMKIDNTKDDIKRARKILDDLELENLSLDRKIYDDGDNLSGGQKLKISIARAIFKNASLIILDEPTASLDKKSEEIIINLLKNLNKSLIITSHRQKTLDIADHIYQLDKDMLRRVK